MADGARVRVGIVVGSESDLPVMSCCADVLDDYGIRHEIGVMSAHRSPEVVASYARQARGRGLRVLVAGAGAAAALAGGPRRLHDAAGHRCTTCGHASRRVRLAAQHRSDAPGRSRRNRRRRRDGRAECRSPGGADARARGPVARGCSRTRSGLDAWPDKTSGGLRANYCRFGGDELSQPRDSPLQRHLERLQCWREGSF